MNLRIVDTALGMLPDGKPLRLVNEAIFSIAAVRHV